MGNDDASAVCDGDSSAGNDDGFDVGNDSGSNDGGDDDGFGGVNAGRGVVWMVLLPMMMVVMAFCVSVLVFI